MAIQNVEPTTTPINYRDQKINLAHICDAFGKNPTLRNYPVYPDSDHPYYDAPTLPESKPSSNCASGQSTPLYASPMQPTEYFKVLSKCALDLLHRRYDRPKVPFRERIEDAKYWKEEVRFFSDFVPHYKEKREDIIKNTKYWICDSNYWEKASHEKIEGTRFDIQDLSYWKCELAFLRQLPETHAIDRSGILNAEYWQIELYFYQHLCDTELLSSCQTSLFPADNIQTLHETLEMATYSESASALLPLTTKTNFQLEQLSPMDHRNSSSLKRKRPLLDAEVVTSDDALLETSRKIPRIANDISSSQNPREASLNVFNVFQEQRPTCPRNMEPGCFTADQCDCIGENKLLYLSKPGLLFSVAFPCEERLLQRGNRIITKSS